MDVRALWTSDYDWTSDFDGRQVLGDVKRQGEMPRTVSQLFLLL